VRARRARVHVHGVRLPRAEVGARAWAEASTG
jgi:hypothetical protein